LFFVSTQFVVFSQKQYSFEHLTTKDGLSQGTVNEIIKDSKGFMWFGTNDGLNKQYGTNIEVFRNNVNDSVSLSNNLIVSLAEDKNGRIWVNTHDEELQFFDSDSSGFYSYKVLFPNDTNSIGKKNMVYKLYYQGDTFLWVGSVGCVFKIDLKQMTIKKYTYYCTNIPGSEEKITSIIEDETGRLWFGSYTCGLLYYDQETDSVLHLIKMLPASEQHTIIPAITALAIGADHNLWIGSFQKYISILNPGTFEISKFIPYGSTSRDSFDYYRLIDLVSDNDSSIWVGSIGGNVQIINVFTKKVTSIVKNPNDPKSLLSESVKSIFIDQNRTVWLGDNGFGVNLYFPYAKDFGTIVYNRKTTENLQFSSIRTIFKDKSDILWIGGYGGLNALDEKHGLLKEYFKYLPVYFVYPDKKNEDLLWVGLEGGGIFLIEKSTAKVIRELVANENNPNALVGVNIYSIVQADENGLWIGTESALNYLNCNTFKFMAFRNNDINSTLPNRRLRSLFIDSKNRFWVGGLEGGLAMRMPQREKFVSFTHKSGDKGAISSNTIYCVFESQAGVIYIGTHNGLNVYNEETGKFKVFTTSDGLPNNVVYGILEDEENNNLWLSTNYGLSKFDPHTGSFRNYDDEDGLSGNEFNSGAFFKDKQGTMYFGGIDGITYFDPQHIHDNPIEPKILFTYFKKGNDIVKMIPSISQTSEIKLKYNESNVSIGFEALNYYKPAKTLYAYRLSTDDTGDWIYLKNKNSIEFNQLRPGSYILKIIATNNDHVWTKDGISLTIKVSAPFWHLWWFLILFLITILTITFVIIYFRTRLVEKQKDRLEKEIAIRTEKLKITNKHLKTEIEERTKIESELINSNRTKDKFFSIIAHDLKSPFNALLGLTDYIVDEYDSFTEPERKEYLNAFRNSIRDVYKLIQNLLTWSSSHRGYLEFNPEYLDLELLIEENISIAKQQANKKSIVLLTDILPKATVFADYYMIDTVLRNLISNAIKFTMRGGNVTIRINDKVEDIEICIIDSGIGMTEETLNKLFMIDEKSSTPGTENEHGTGLGLILCQEFIAKNNGTIHVSSTPDKGSTFSITLPKKDMNNL
jgi:signal transduction histidine kinase/ligand-binding sensor domain-containing protein